MLENFDFALLDNEDFKEDSVREFIIAPILARLGFVVKNDKSPQKLEMLLSKTLKAQIQIGSNKSIDTDLTPDYLLCVSGKNACVLDAKSPKIDISKGSKAQKQALSYMLAFETSLYALCNGRAFIVFDAQGVVLEVDLKNELNATLDRLKQVLTGEKSQKPQASKKPDEWYLSREIPKPRLKPKKRAAKRHYGCLAYFTRQSWDIVTDNIKAFTDEGDIVLDSFGGSGVTAIEAMMNNRFGIHTDLNPLSIFMVKALCAKVNLGDLHDLSEEILSEFESLRPKNEKEAKALLKGAKYYPNAIDKEFGEIANAKMQDSTLWIPKDEILPKGSDVPSVLGLFSKTQLAELAILRKLIMRKTTKNKEMRYSLLLAFYNTITRCNLTFHYADSVKSAGDSGIYKYYRYRIAPKPGFLDIGKHFQDKVKRTYMGKKELQDSQSFYNSYFAPLQRVIKDFNGSMMTQRENVENIDSLESKTNGEKIFQADATNLAEIESESIDFIYTDPPYGAKIPYLDLSTMWNVWLDLPVDLNLKEKECIEKGSLEKSKYDYENLMKQSLKEMYRVLKFNRWLAFVFQHQDTRLYQIIVESAENVGFEYAGFTSQENIGIASFKKVQNPTRVLKGQLIIYFKKIDNAKARVKTETGTETLEQMFKDIEKVIVENNGASLELINANLVKMALEGGYHRLMSKFENVLLLINERFDYDSETKLYNIRDSARIFNYGIPVEERARYYILGELKKADRERRGVKFDSLCLYILPLLKNGIQANNKLVREILNELAIEDKETGEWKLKTQDARLFDF